MFGLIDMALVQKNRNAHNDGFRFETNKRMSVFEILFYLLV